MSHESTIQRCPHDKENPYVMISRSLIRDQSFSLECRMLIILFLSFREGWKFSIPMLMKQQKISKDRMYRILDEAMEAGYIKREEEVIAHPKNKNLNLTRYTYFVSETAKFKKSFRRPENQDDGNSSEDREELKEFFPRPEFQDPEKQDTKNTSFHSLIDNNKVEKEQSPTGTDANASHVCEKEIPLRAFGKYVKLTPDEHSSLGQEFGEVLVKQIIIDMNDYISAKGKKPYKDFAAAIRLWIRRNKNTSSQPQGFSKYPDRRQRYADGTFVENPWEGVF